MQTDRILLTALLVLAGTNSAGAADLSRIDHTLPSEPTYRSGAPKYCLLVFGPEAETRVWLVRDGNVLHVYDSADGKSPKAWRQVRPQRGDQGDRFDIGDVWEVDGKTQHTELTYEPNRTYKDFQLSVSIGGKNGDDQYAGRDRSGKLAFADRAKDAPIVHFNGPLTMTLYRTQEPLRRGESVYLKADVGTPGSGPGTFASLDYDGYSKGMPTADVEFPLRDPAGKPVVVRIRLQNYD